MILMLDTSACMLDVWSIAAAEGGYRTKIALQHQQQHEYELH